MLKKLSPPRVHCILRRSTLFNDETFLLVATTSRREQGQGRESRLRNVPVTSSSGFHNHEKKNCDHG